MDSIARHLDDVSAAFAKFEGDTAFNLGSQAAQFVLVTRARVAIERAFPRDHLYAQQVNDLFKECQMSIANEPGCRQVSTIFRHAGGLLDAARHDYNNGYLRSLSRAVELKTVGDVLSQATTLLAEGFLVPAAVLAGGALEIHLKELVETAGIAVKGQRSIATYNAAIREQERQGNPALYDKEAAKEVISIGGLRNEAAHEPAKFDKGRTREEIRLMIERVRLFVKAHE